MLARRFVGGAKQLAENKSPRTGEEFHIECVEKCVKGGGGGQLQIARIEPGSQICVRLSRNSSSANNNKGTARQNALVGRSITRESRALEHTQGLAKERSPPLDTNREQSSHKTTTCSYLLLLL